MKKTEVAGISAGLILWAVVGASAMTSREIGDVDCFKQRTVSPENAGLSEDEARLSRGVKVARVETTKRPPPRQKIAKDSTIQRIERALDESKRNRKRVYANSRAVTHKANQQFVGAFPDVCKTPPTIGPIPIPYPNIGMSSDTAKGSKEVKADSAETMARASGLKKSESDELGRRMTRLERDYRRIIAKRELSAKEEAAFRKELKTCLDQASLLKKTLDQYVEEIEKLLEQARRGLSATPSR